MTPNDQDFVDLCTALRLLGALTVESEGRRATFSPAPPRPIRPVAETEIDPLTRFPRAK